MRGCGVVIRNAKRAKHAETIEAVQRIIASRLSLRRARGTDPHHRYSQLGAEARGGSLELEVRM